MASAKDLRKRISSVKNTQQITKAMKMVSAAKLRRAQENILALRPYAKEIAGVIERLSKSSSDELQHPLLEQSSSQDLTTHESCLLIVVTSDRGLCGGFNANVIKAVQRFIRSTGHKYKKFDLAFIGKKGFEFFKLRKPGKYYNEMFAGLNFARSKNFSKELIDLYLSGEYKEIKFVYNEFKSAISQKVNVETLLPIRTLSEVPSTEPTASGDMMLFEPNAKDILEEILPAHFAAQVHRVLLESLASEHGARMAAMENATKNAGEMIRKITLLYNKTRQAGITKELLEIVSGSEAQKA